MLSTFEMLERIQINMSWCYKKKPTSSRGPVGLSSKIHRLHLCWYIRSSSRTCSGCDVKLSNSQATVKVLWRIEYTFIVVSSGSILTHPIYRSNKPFWSFNCVQTNYWSWIELLLVSFYFFNGISTFMGYLMPKPSF